MRRLINGILAIIFLSISFFACTGNKSEKQGVYTTVLNFKPGQEDEIEEALLDIKDSTHIYLEAGHYEFDNLSIAQVKHVLFQGAGYDKTILDFSKQETGGEGVRVTDVNSFTIDAMTIRDSKGDLLKINNGHDVNITNVHTIWSQADSTSGGYGIYPVMCSNVLVENCYAEGASDAGIYVGQTKKAIVRNSKASKNVAGCEIENTTDAEVYDNEFYNNTAGFLIFDLPDLSQRGGNVKVYNNKIYDNNHRNFARAGHFGTYWGVGNASPGSGVIILSTSGIEIYENDISDNNTSAITIASGFTTDESAAEKISDKYSPIPSNIKIYGNTITMGEKFPEPAYTHRIGQLLIATEAQLNKLDENRANKRIPAILYDGVTSNVLTNGTEINPDNICIDQPGENIFVFADFRNIEGGENWKPNTNITPFQCK